MFIMFSFLFFFLKIKLHLLTWMKMSFNFVANAKINTSIFLKAFNLILTNAEGISKI